MCVCSYIERHTHIHEKWCFNVFKETSNMLSYDIQRLYLLWHHPCISLLWNNLVYSLQRGKFTENSLSWHISWFRRAPPSSRWTFLCLLLMWAQNGQSICISWIHEHFQNKELFLLSWKPKAFIFFFKFFLLLAQASHVLIQTRDPDILKYSKFC